MEPAELGNSVHDESPMQKAKATGEDLRGSYNVAHPATDAVNGVTGAMSVSWTFTRS